MAMIVVYLNDSKIAYEQAEDYFAEASSWASCHCNSYIDYHVQDVSDVSYVYDHVASYHFKDSKDALLFELKYKDS